MDYKRELIEWLAEFKNTGELRRTIERQAYTEQECAFIKLGLVKARTLVPLAPKKRRSRVEAMRRAGLRRRTYE